MMQDIKPIQNTSMLANNELVSPASSKTEVVHNNPPALTKKRIGHKKAAGIIVFIAVLSAITFFVLYVIWSLQSRDAGADKKAFLISKGENAISVAKRLEDEGLIRNAKVFRTLLLITEKADDIKAGEFDISSAMTPQEIISVLTAKAPPERDVNVVIPEGFTLAQIDARFANAGIIKEGDLLNGSGAIYAYEFLPECPARHQNDDGQYVCNVEYMSLEGYLFPDTYRFKRDSTTDIIVGKMLDNFDKKLSLPLRSDIAIQNKSIKDIVIMASILEKEVRSDVDKTLVAGILWKRLNQLYPLQVDAPVLYALELAGRAKLKGQTLTLEDLQVDSAYNTYKYKGLPPGAISNPGLASIDSAIDLENSNYFSYLSAPDGTTIFSRTLTEHNRAKIRYLR